MRKALLALLFGSAVALAACGNSGGTQSSPAGGGTESSPAVESPSDMLSSPSDLGSPSMESPSDMLASPSGS